MFHDLSVDLLSLYLGKVTLFFIDLFDPIFPRAVLFSSLEAKFHFLLYNIVYLNQLNDFISGGYRLHNLWIIG